MLFEPKEIKDLFDRFSRMRVLVVGDVMIDAYLWGKVKRISPEAPVPVVEVSKREARLGGAANVALNLHALGAEPIICSVIGKDEKGAQLKALLEERMFSARGLVESDRRVTTSKTRVISSGQQIVRVDEEMVSDIDEESEKELLKTIVSLLDEENIDVVVFEDYNKGVLTEGLISAVIKAANEREVPTTVDPKKANFLSFKNCTLFKPNLKELREGTKLDFEAEDGEGLLRAVRQVENELGNQWSLITLSEHGVFIKEGDDFHLIPAHRREILDVSGAGDTVISVASLALAAACSGPQIAALSNLAGGLVCEKVGVVPISKTQLMHEALSLKEVGAS